MKKILYILLVIDIISLIIGFFAILANSIIYAVIFAVLGIIGLVPLVALIRCLESVEELENDISYLYYRLKKFEDNFEQPEKESAVPSAENKDTAVATWECVKCGTVNKANTNHCSNCKAPYSPFVNPTDNPYAKKKVSRWIKYK